jgi:Tfp pilus assembly protein PilN
LASTELQKRQERYEALKAEYDSQAEEAKKVLSLRETIRIIGERLDSKDSAVNMLHAMNVRTPKAVRYSQVSYEQGKHLELRGFARSIPDVRLFEQALQSEEIFVGVENEEMQTTAGGVKFRLRCLLARADEGTEETE